MVDTAKLRGRIAECGLSQSEVAKRIGIAPRTFFAKMKRGVFGTDEALKMTELLNISDPAAIFLAKR